MRMTIDIPDPLFREVKATAARKGVLLKEFITAALIREVAGGIMEPRQLGISRGSMISCAAFRLPMRHPFPR